MTDMADPKVDVTRQQVRLRGRSYVAFVFAPVVPIVDWLSEIDATLATSPGSSVARSAETSMPAAMGQPMTMTPRLEQRLREAMMRVIQRRMMGRAPGSAPNP